ncbi:hypothetical protein OUZ56_012986 [Daphnia magna]|uniref:Uncharacterized protein n=1 Tax=Daphnia magna TaxID=35525 RepID=A0ABQ9Z4K1_9CRUS|nr:hypothetical protein OUZ56_012986 [Daphnia magna]
MAKKLEIRHLAGTRYYINTDYTGAPAATSRIKIRTDLLLSQLLKRIGAEEMEVVITIDTLRRCDLVGRMVSIVPDTSLEDAHATGLTIGFDTFVCEIQI